MTKIAKPTMREIVSVSRELDWDGEGLPPIGGASPIQSQYVAGIAKENVYGTFAAPTRFIPCIPQIRGNTKIVRPDQARGTRDQVVDPIVGYEVDVTLTGELIPDGTFGQLCAGAFGSGSDSSTSTGFGVYAHSMTPQPQLPSFSYEQDEDVIPGEQILARQVAGCFVDQFQLKATNQSIAQVTASLIGQRELTPATPGNPSSVNPTFFNTIQPMDFSLLAATYKGASTTQLIDVTLALLNHTVRVFTNNGKLYVARLAATKREVTLTTLLDFLDTVFYNDWINGTKTSGFVFTLTAATNIPGGGTTPWSVAFTIPGTRPMGEYSNPVASDVVQQNITWSATLSGANAISSVWTNGDGGTYS